MARVVWGIWYDPGMAIEVEAAPPARRSIRFDFRRDMVFFGVVAAILVADQALKWYITETFSRGEYWPSRDWPVRITYVENAGAAFGILQNQGFFLIASTLIGLGAIVAYYLYPPFEHGILRLAMAMMLGGAIGNLIDRIRQGYVVDFINTSFWPTFNVADSSISIGMVILVAFLVLADRKRDAPATAPPPAEPGEATGE
jgi:signal peptidase II